MLNEAGLVIGSTQWTKHETENFIQVAGLCSNNKPGALVFLWWQWHFGKTASVVLFFLFFFEMSIRARSHTDLQMSSLDDSLYKSFSMSSSNVNRGSRFKDGVTEEVKVLSRPSRRPVRAVRPVSAVSSNGSFLQLNHLQGELVRKRKVRR